MLIASAGNTVFVDFCFVEFSLCRFLPCATRTNNMASLPKVNVVMCGTGEYTTGFVGAGK